MPIDNMASVTTVGILCHVDAGKHPHRSIAAQEIQERRKRVKVPGGLRLHEYANLYFDARNSMMFLRKADHESLCVISVKPAVLDHPGTPVPSRM